MADPVLLIICGATAVPIFVIVAEVAAAALCATFGRVSVSLRPDITASPPALSPSRSLRVSVLIPAHNEEQEIATTIASILPQLLLGDRLLVVADNCTDATAEVAGEAGAEVIERQSAAERGKGFALAAGVKHLSVAPPDVVVILDADTVPHSGAVDALARAASMWRRPVQCLYLLGLSNEAKPRDFISAFAFCLKNHVRPLGARVLRLPCHLTGTGMAFPWEIICDANLATGNIVEDMQLGIDLVIIGHPPVFCSAARVTGKLPSGNSAATSQRTRWEHGHLQTIFHNCPRLVWQGIRQRRVSLIALALDLAVPPLALLTSLWIGTTCLATVAAATGCGTWLPVWVSLAAGGVFVGSILLSWAVFARQILPFASLLSIPLYIAWKVPLYFAFVFRRQKAWVRTAR